LKSLIEEWQQNTLLPRSLSHQEQGVCPKEKPAKTASHTALQIGLNDNFPHPFLLPCGLEIVVTYVKVRTQLYCGSKGIRVNLLYLEMSTDIQERIAAACDRAALV